jgi:hypothetical protein
MKALQEQSQRSRIAIGLGFGEDTKEQIAAIGAGN